MFQMFLSSAIFALMAWICEATEMPVYTTWTIYTTEKPWNEAEMVCELSGGHLANLNTTHKVTVFEEMLKKPPWSTAVSYGTTVSLHNLQNEAEDPRYWLNDCDVNSISFTYSSTWPISSGPSGCASKGSSKIWKISCDRDNEYTCERQWGTACPYEVLNEMRATSGFSHTSAGSLTQEQCLESCDAAGTDCWAAQRQHSDGRCLLYNVPSPFSFDDVTATMTADTTQTMYIKRCYEGLVKSNSYNWMHFPVVKPVSTCNANGASGRVYTLLKEKKTWDNALVHCQSIGQSLAGARLEEDRSFIQLLVEEFYQSTYDVNGRNPHWVDFTGPRTGFSSWRNGSMVSAAVSVDGTDNHLCGALNLNTGHHSLHNCMEKKSFICVKTGVPCMTVVKKDAINSQNVDKGSLSVDQCTVECQNYQAPGAACQVFFHKAGFSQKCRLYTSPFSTFFPPSSSSSSFDLYRLTCVWAVLQEEVLIENITTEVSPSPTTTTPPEPETTTSQPETTPSTTTANDEGTSTTSNDGATSTVASPTIATQSATTTAMDEETSTTNNDIATSTDTVTQNPTESASPSITTQTATTRIPEPTTELLVTGSQQTTTTNVVTSSLQTASNSGPSMTDPLATDASSSAGQHQHDTTSSPSETSTSLTNEVTITTPATGQTTDISNVTQCLCICRVDPINISYAAAVTEAKKLSEELKVEPNSTFINRAKFYSIPDNRPSSISIGVVAILCITFVIGSIVLIDFTRLVTHCCANNKAGS